MSFNDQAKAWWIKQGGSIHGPNIETATIPVANLIRILYDVAFVRIALSKIQDQVTLGHMVDLPTVRSNLKKAITICPKVPVGIPLKRIPKTIKCEDCNGLGWVYISTTPNVRDANCSTCKGIGRVTNPAAII